jgi:hypothetical protein
MRAFPPEADHAPPGRLFIVNRGPYGFGYHQCDRCECSIAAESPAPLNNRPHKNPRSGEQCRSKTFAKKIDLGHIFNTDVLQIRFARAIPPLSFGSSVESAQNFGRTITEATRLAAIRMLELDSRSLRGTFQINDARLYVTLYDNVPGGAGYVGRISEPPYGIDKLLEAALSVLDCSEECASSCRRCPNDYAKQG